MPSEIGHDTKLAAPWQPFHFSPPRCVNVFLFFLLEIRSVLHSGFFFATAEPESRPSDKIRNVRLPDSAPASHVTPSIFHTWTNDVPALSPNGRGYCVHDALYVVRRTESADCYTKISCLSHALENSLYYICLIANHKSCLCARDLTKHLTVPDMWNISVCHPVFFTLFLIKGNFVRPAQRRKTIKCQCLVLVVIYLLGPVLSTQWR